MCTTPDEAEQLSFVMSALRPEGGPFDVVLAPEPGAPPQEWAEAGVTWLLRPFSQFGTRAEDVGRVADAGPPALS